MFLAENQDPLEDRFLTINILLGTISRQALRSADVGSNKGIG